MRVRAGKGLKDGSGAGAGLGLDVGEALGEEEGICVGAGEGIKAAGSRQKNSVTPQEYLALTHVLSQQSPPSLQ